MAKCSCTLAVCLVYTLQVQSLDVRGIARTENTSNGPATPMQQAQDLSVQRADRENGTANETATRLFLNQTKPKVFFVAALEGSGTAVFQKLWKNSFEDIEEAARHVLKFPKEWKCGADWRFTGYDDLVSRLRKIKLDDVHALPFQATYPSCGARTHDHEGRVSIFHPDLEWIQAAADEAGVALHVIFIKRSLIDCLKLTCAKRDYETCPAQAKTLSYNAEILRKQLNSLDRSMISCFDYSSDAQVLQDIHNEFGKKLPVIDEEFKSRDVSHLTELQGVPLEELSSQTVALSDLCRSVSEFKIKDFKQFILRGHGKAAHLAQQLVGGPDIRRAVADD